MDALQVIAEPRRQAILRAVWDEERSAGEIAARFDDITFGAVSQHLRILLDAGLLDRRQEANYRYYRANKRSLGPLRAYLEQLWSSHLDALKEAAEADERMRSRPSLRDKSGRR